MMWRSVKALDLLRDPRCTTSTCIAPYPNGRDGTEGENSSSRWRWYGRAVEVTDPEELRQFCDAVYAAIGLRIEDMEGQGHCFAIAIDSVVFSQLRGEEFHRQVWKS